jgi:hypothetical protein
VEWLLGDNRKRTAPSKASPTATLTSGSFANKILANQVGRSLTDRA